MTTLADVKLRMEEELAEKTGQENEPPSLFQVTRQRVRYWTDGLIIGSEGFLRATMASRTPNAAKHRVACLAPDPEGTAFAAWRRIRTIS